MAARIVFFAAMMFISVLHSYAQDFSVSAESQFLVEKKEGFENARCFIQDQNGFFWVGSKGGVVRYNGQEVDRLEDLLAHNPPSLLDITALHLDKSGNIWIGHRGKVSRLVISSMTVEEISMISRDSAISRLPNINDLHIADNGLLLITTNQGFYILSQSDTESNTWQVSLFRQLEPTADESEFINGLQSKRTLSSSLIIRDSLRHSISFSVKDSTDFLIVSRSPKMFSGIDDLNDRAWIENQHGETVWLKYSEFYFLSLHPSVLRLGPGTYTLYGHMKLYNYFSDILPEYTISMYEVDSKSAQLFRKINLDWRNRRSIVEDNTGVMLADKQGSVWISGGGGLTSLKFVGGKSVFKVYTPHEGKEFGQHGIHTFTIKSSGADGFWLLGRGYSQLAQLRQGKNIFGQNHVMFYKADRQRFSRLAYEGTDLIADIAEDRDSSLWILHENGSLNRITFDTKFALDPKQVDLVDLSSFGRAFKMLIDRTGNLWVLTQKQGLIKITPNNNNVSVWSWPYDKVLFGRSHTSDESLLFTNDGSVFKSRVDGTILDVGRIGTLEHPVIDFIRLSDTTAIAATRNGRIHFLNKHWRSDAIIAVDSLHINPRFPIVAIKLVKISDNIVYLCTNQGLFTIEVNQKTISGNLFDPQPHIVELISDVISYRQKQLAVLSIFSRSRGYSGQVVPVGADHQKRYLVNPRHADLGVAINAIVQWADKILVGSELGIHEYIPEKDTFLLFSPAGFPAVYNMLADNDKFLWTFGRDGATCFDIKSGRFHMVAKFLLPEKKINEISPVIWQSDRKNVFFTANNRLYKLLIDSAHVQENKPLIHIDHLVVQNSSGENRKVHPVRKMIVLSSGQRTFTIHFAATDLAFPERAYFSYRLIGYHEEWINTTYSDIQFINVPPGDYTLELRVVDGLKTNSTSMFLTLQPFWWQTMSARLMFGVVFLFILWWVSYTYKRHSNLRRNLEKEHIEKEKIAMMSQMRSRFFANISHEFRTPLTLISGPIEDRVKSEEDPRERETLNRVLDQTKRMLKLVNELLDLSRLESGRLPLETKAADIMHYANSVAESFNDMATEKKLKYLVSIERKAVYLDFDAEQIAKVLVNLISNAIKFCPFGGTVSLVLGYDDRAQQLSIEVWNNGNPIPEGELSMIFSPFYRAGNAQTQGSGIGLALVKELVENMKGSVVAFSDPVNGNKFRVCIPLQKAMVPEFPKEAPQSNCSATESVSLGDQPPLASPPILIIEDDDDMRDYLYGMFAPARHVLTAGNGEIGFKIATEIIPDLVICDIMMPGSDGIVCCEKLKSDQRTDHIPIILLTAKTELTDRLTGLRAGADDYITKPFSSEELKMKVNNLVNQRNQLKLRFGRHIQSTYKDLPIGSADERFVNKAIAIVHQHIGNSDFDITQFSSSMNLSRTHLHKKLKVITGQSPSEFIRNLRLQRAAELLAAGTDQVSPIAYDTGFNNLSYFTRMFKAKYGVPPTEYKRQTNVKSQG